MTYRPGDILQGNYCIEEQLGQGAFGDVYLVTHQGLKVKRAIKVLRRGTPGLGSNDFKDAKARFQLEAWLGALLNTPSSHPNLLNVHNFSEAENLLVLEMEFASGGSLEKRLIETGPLSISETVQLGLDLCAGLEALHARDVIHRDIKPSNILFSADGKAKIADLGLAQVLSDESRRFEFGSLAGAHPGTPLYMSPEQANSIDILQPGSDIFSLGCVLFEALTGQKYKKHLGTRARAHRKEVPGWLDGIITRMLAERPGVGPADDSDKNKRYRLVSQVRAALEHGRRERQTGRSWAAWLGGAVGLMLIIWLGKSLFSGGLIKPTPGDSPIIAQIPAVYPTVVQISSTPTLEPISPLAVLPSATLLPAELTLKEVSMVLIPAGSFNMGGRADEQFLECQKFESGCQRTWFLDEEPIHLVALSPFYLDKYEVTNGLYKTCVDAGVCSASLNSSSATRSSYYGNPEYDDFPVLNVDWNMAKVYCEWRGGRLPSEAEWEYAARGLEGRSFPWGNEFASTYANYNFTDTLKVGSYENGKSPEGVYDLAGNVMEWVNDWYDENYYIVSESTNPTGPAAAQYRAVRGGSWLHNGLYIRSSIRAGSNPTEGNNFIGFRCAVSR